MLKDLCKWGPLTIQGPYMTVCHCEAPFRSYGPFVISAFGLDSEFWQNCVLGTIQALLTKLGARGA